MPRAVLPRLSMKSQFGTATPTRKVGVCNPDPETSDGCFNGYGSTF
jgi:hypothetical protein